VADRAKSHVLGRFARFKVGFSVERCRFNGPGAD
jgi:hypothetical protein